MARWWAVCAPLRRTPQHPHAPTWPGMRRPRLVMVDSRRRVSAEKGRMALPRSRASAATAAMFWSAGTAAYMGCAGARGRGGGGWGGGWCPAGEGALLGWVL